RGVGAAGPPRGGSARRVPVAALGRRGDRMRRIVFFLGGVAAGVGALVGVGPRKRDAGQGVFVRLIPPGDRGWELVSGADGEGNLNDIRAILGNDAAIKAYRDKTLPFPDGAIIARIAWKYVPSEENNRIFGREQSFVAGDPPEWYLQFMVKDSKKYAATGGWGYAQFDKDGKPAAEAKMKTCF